MPQKKMNPTDPAEVFTALWSLVERLRAPGGCPWDAKQTAESIKTYVLEEAYEVADAVERRSPEEVCHELGDLLFQVLFMASIYKGSGDFDLVEVLETIRKKMVRRHPHVFGPAEVNSAEEVAANWEKIKKEELGLSENDRWPLEKVPENLPALLRAHRLIERAVKHRLLAPGDEERGGDLRDPWGALKEAVLERDRERIATTIGEALFGLVALAREWGLNGEDLLREKNRHFIEETKQRHGEEEKK
jgi:tetrapyrrole methylase family protein/MazG family protein